jgi:Spy/CpxP family protein refolding chaperone
MKSFRIAQLALVMGMALAAPLSSYANPKPMMEHGTMHDMGPGAHDRFLHGIALSEEQQDKIFAIHNAQAPAMREQHKIVRKAHTELHALVASGQYDERKVRALAETGAKAMAELQQMQARSHAQILQLLTPEQRQQIAQRAAGMHAEMHGSGRPAMGHSPQSH